MGLDREEAGGVLKRVTEGRRRALVVAGLVGALLLVAGLIALAIHYATAVPEFIVHTVTAGGRAPGTGRPRPNEALQPTGRGEHRG